MTDSTSTAKTNGHHSYHLTRPNRRYNLTLMNSCTSLGATVGLPASARTLTGLFSDSFTRSSTLAVIVAEKSSVCRFTGQCLSNSSISSWKPNSNSLQECDREGGREVAKGDGTRPWDWLHSRVSLDVQYFNHPARNQPNHRRTTVSLRNKQHLYLSASSNTSTSKLLTVTDLELRKWSMMRPSDVGRSEGSRRTGNSTLDNVVGV